ncbi:MAG: hypothetical protein ACM3U1_09085 [Chloroflexota bacterium]
MRKISILIALLSIATHSLFSQDRAPSPLRFNYQYEERFYHDTVLSQEVFKQKKFVLGSQWGMHPRVARALKMNVNQGWQPKPGGPADQQLYRNPFTDYPLYHIWNCEQYEPGMGFVFEPTLYIPPAQRGQFITKPNDTTRAIWGFSDYRGEITLI